jgi:hypothetical protein
LDGTTPLPKFDYFSNAPRLRYVDLDCKYSNSGPAAIDLPWSHLQSLRSRLSKQSTAAYEGLIKSRPLGLKKLDYAMERKFWQGLSLPNTPCFLPNLTELHLYLGFNDSSEFTLFAGHMGTLSLPSLTTLTLVHVHYSSVGPLEDLASNVVFLIQRSKCDLRKLTIIDQRAPDAPDALHDVLVTCPNLAELDIPKPTAGFLNRLTLHPAQRTPILPYLTHLKIHCDAIEEDDERTVSIPALMRLVLSREGGLNCLESDSPPFRCLQEVYLDSVNLSILQRDITLWECERIFPERYSAGCWRNHTSCQETLGLAKAAAAQLHSYWIALQQNKVYLHVYMETDRTIRNLEELHAERLNMLVFLVRPSHPALILFPSAIH